MTDALKRLSDEGVAIWLDDLSRKRITSGNLAELMDASHVVGVTTNPTIFQKAISAGDGYQQQVSDLAARRVTVEEAIRMITTADVRDAADVLRPVFDATDLKTDGSDFDALFRDGEIFAIGDLEVEVLHLPGHTPADVAYRIGDAVFAGDTIFMPDYGTARADFPGGDARALYRSIRKLLSLPPGTRLFMCHDYKAPGRDRFAWETTVGEERTKNVHIHDGVTEADFVAMRTARDATLAAPVLLLPSIQVNIRAGHLPQPESNGTRYLKIPLRLDETLKSIV